MACCEEKAIGDIYTPLNKRLVEFGSEVLGPAFISKMPHTLLWIFTFFYEEDLCEECKVKFTNMNYWFHKYGLFEDPVRNVKWIVENEPNKNLIYQEMGFTKSPMHIFTNENGDVIDIVTGFPEERWLEKYILPIIQQSKAPL